MAENPPESVKITDLTEVRKTKKPGKIDRIDLNARIEEINKEFCVIQRGSQVLIMRHWVSETGQSRTVFFKRQDFLLLMENRRISVENDDGEKTMKPLGPLWLASAHRAQYEEVYFEPEGPESSLRYNLWQGFAFIPNASSGTFDTFLEHVRENICQNDKELFIWVISWLADLFQNPAKKPGTALILRGEMRTGKGQFITHIGRLLGVHYMTVTNARQVTGNFNGHMADKVLVFADETFWSDSKQGAGVLRALITEMHLAVEMKGRDTVMMDNYTRLVAAANDDWAVPVGFKDEGRMAVLDVGSKRHKDFAYFSKMEAELQANNNGGYKALLHYLRHYQYDPQLPRTIPMTKALLDQKKHSMPHWVKWWFGALSSRHIVRPDRDMDNWPAPLITTTAFYESYTRWCVRMNIKDVLDSTWLVRKLGGWISLRKERIRGEDTYYHVEAIDEARARFDKQIGHKIEWDDCFKVVPGPLEADAPAYDPLDF